MHLGLVSFMPFFLLFSSITLLMLLPFLLIEFTFTKYKDTTCFSQADRKKILRDHTRNILNLVPMKSSSHDMEDDAVEDFFQPYEQWNGQSYIDQYYTDPDKFSKLITNQNEKKNKCGKKMNDGEPLLLKNTLVSELVSQEDDSYKLKLVDIP